MASWFEQAPPRNYKKNRANKPKSFDESICIPKNSPTSFATNYGYYSYTYTQDKKLHPVFPLPLPLDSPNFSTRSSSGSSPTSSQFNDDEEQRISPLFSPFRNKCNDWSRTSNESSKSNSPCTSPTTYPVELDKKLDSPNGKQEECNHPRHPLPLPPNSSTKGRTGQWKKGKLLAKGTFGNVYAGFNSDNGQMCAIKEVRIIFNDTTSKERLKQLNQEITLLSQFSHPNIVQYYGSELRGDRLSLYLEYVPGGSILKLLQEYGPFEEQIISSYTRKILSGLVFLHERNIAHRDIKGANILVNAKGEIKLADFGMAKHINSCCLMDSFKGSPYWMAPEQVVKDAGGSSVAVDIWSLGCTVVEMATAKPPYEGGAALLFKQVDGKDSPEIPRNLSDNAKSFLKLCLQRNPSRRLTAVRLLNHPFVQA
ncbi:mitogen-activated protein kinase kinase kinase 3-like isoform X1 [Solanum stenotomum]|uniref:mitogen-activated protein kinase kinase kinase 3-like isoform X1 n=1 Tax=Solanum stenotomum TaxID=172797 RepID=UPI0020D05792|nr:mitogen-activated protein kinase kinase kinase 3-like isoform X1 [Solanum stenotomum]